MILGNFPFNAKCLCHFGLRFLLTCPVLTVISGPYKILTNGSLVPPLSIDGRSFASTTVEICFVSFKF